jgi:uncharacterized repeat protein (TIGR01451 family)
MCKLFTLERFIGLIGLVALLFVGLLWNPAPVAGQEPEERPTIVPPTTTPLPGMGASSGQPPSLSGTVINWGFRNEPNIPIQARGVDWRLDTTSNEAGFYRFDGLSSNVVWLNVVPPEGSNAKLLTTDVAVRPTIGVATIVNLGIYEGDEPLPLPVAHTMEASVTQAQPGDQVTFTIWVKNNLDTPITHAQLTDYLPAGLGFVSAESEHGPASYADNLVAADLGTLGSGDEATVTIVALVEPDGGESWELTNRSSLVYWESVATQASATLSVVGGPTGELPVTGAPMPLVAVGLGALVLIARRLRTHSV